MSSCNYLHPDIILHRRQAQAYKDFVRGREAFDMRELIQEFEDASFVQGADMRRNGVEEMRMQEILTAQMHQEACAREQQHVEEMYHTQQKQEALEKITDSRFSRENMQHRAGAAGIFPSAFAASHLNTNTGGFSETAGHATLLHQGSLWERALVLAHAKRVENDALRMQRARSQKSVGT